MFSRDLRERVADGEITVSVRLWSRPQVKVGGRYQTAGVVIEIDSIEMLPFSAVTDDDVAASGEADGRLCGTGQLTPGRSAKTPSSTGSSSTSCSRRRRRRGRCTSAGRSWASRSWIQDRTRVDGEVLGGDPLGLGVFVDTQAHGGYLLPFGRRRGGALGFGRRSWSARRALKAGQRVARGHPTLTVARALGSPKPSSTAAPVTGRAASPTNISWSTRSSARTCASLRAATTAGKRATSNASPHSAPVRRQKGLRRCA